jgi:hypothetical protein
MIPTEARIGIREVDMRSATDSAVDKTFEVKVVIGVGVRAVGVKEIGIVDRHPAIGIDDKEARIQLLIPLLKLLRDPRTAGRVDLAQWSKCHPARWK